jgi:hypothetical protein
MLRIPCPETIEHIIQLAIIAKGNNLTAKRKAAMLLSSDVYASAHRQFADHLLAYLINLVFAD